jgi:Sec-independent protein secretion pathway component TatC
VLNALFWRKNFRYVIILFVIFGAIITPDGSGITMWLVTLLMLLLYFIGMIVIEKRKKRTCKVPHWKIYEFYRRRNIGMKYSPDEMLKESYIILWD